MKDMMKWLANEEDGQGMVEYGLILALVAIVAMVALEPIGNAIKATFNDVTTKLGGTPAT